MEPIIYKPGVYNTPGVYKGAGGIYKGRGVYNDGGNNILYDDLLFCMYGNKENSRFVADYSVGQLHYSNYNSALLRTADVRKDTLPIGEVPIIYLYDVQTSFDYYAADFLFDIDGFTIDFYIKTPWASGTERTKVGYLALRNVSNIWSFFLFGPYVGGIYYNPGTGGQNINTQQGAAGWNHWELDFDTNTRSLTYYLNGVFTKQVTISLSNIKQIELAGVALENNHPETYVSQVAIWKKKMEGACYSMGKYFNV